MAYTRTLAILSVASGHALNSGRTNSSLRIEHVWTWRRSRTADRYGSNRSVSQVCLSHALPDFRTSSLLYVFFDPSMHFVLRFQILFYIQSVDRRPFRTRLILRQYVTKLSCDPFLQLLTSIAHNYVTSGIAGWSAPPTHVRSRHASICRRNAIRHYVSRRHASSVGLVGTCTMHIRVPLFALHTRSPDTTHPMYTASLSPDTGFRQCPRTT